MSSHGLTLENLMAALPPALQKDPKAEALAQAMARLLVPHRQDVERLRMYPAIDTLDEPLLDILAYDFKVDWWDADWDLETKRRTMKASWQVHRTLGTRAAVEKAASAIYPMTRVLEWFEYGGEPYHFRLDVDLPEHDWTPERHKRLMWGLQYYKNLRSHLDSVVYRMEPVRLENRDIFWFAALCVSLWAENRRRLALRTLTASLGVRQEQGTALGLSTGGGVRQALRLGFPPLRVHMRAGNFAAEIVRLDGRRLLDGSWPLCQGMIRGPAMVRVLTRTGAHNRLSAGAAVTADSMWRLDGRRLLDGGKKLNAEIKRSEL